ncbi:MAG: Holliday junction branch migration protein RuvA [Cytophagales bacterium]|jgi:holliday junction DNA helicase RuvA
MISYIKGTVAHVDPTFLIIENQGIGYGMKISLQTYAQVKDLKETKIWVHRHFSVQNETETMYGFFDFDEKHTFLLLTSVSGVGSNTAIMVLSSLSSQELERAILTEDTKTIQSIKGIGLKTAQRLILELKDKIKKNNPTLDVSGLTPASHSNVKQEALLALQTLGIPKATAEKNIDAIYKLKGSQVSLEELIKLALR